MLTPYLACEVIATSSESIAQIDYSLLNQALWSFHLKLDISASRSRQVGLQESLSTARAAQDKEKNQFSYRLGQVYPDKSLFIKDLLTNYLNFKIEVK